MLLSRSKIGQPCVTTHLLDTNAWLRAFGRPHELNSATRLLLSDPTHAPFALSAMSVWEVCTKMRKQPASLALQLPLDAWLAAALPPSFIDVRPVDAAVARLSNHLPGVFHEDPADRIVVATALVHGLVVLTSDEKILAYPHVRSLDTR